jgi:rRNA maturation endonuclease Nob1
MAEQATTTTPAPGDTGAAPDAGTAPASTTPTEPANGSEPDTNSSQEAMVPSHRVREATEARRKAEEEAETLRKENEELRSQGSQTPQANDDEEIDTDVEKLIEPILKKRGYVSKEDMDQAVKAAETKRQYDSDVASLTSQYAESGVPFNVEDVRNYAKENGISISSKASLRAAYTDMNADKILEAERNKAIADFKENGSSTSAETPGGQGAQLPEDKKVEGRNPKEKLMSRIRNATSRT